MSAIARRSRSKTSSTYRVRDWGKPTTTTSDSGLAERGERKLDGLPPRGDGAPPE